MLSTWLRTVGGVSEGLGVLAVAVELRRVRRDFPLARPGLVRRAVRRLLRREPETQVVMVHAADELNIALSAEARKWSDEWDADDKIAELRRQVSRLYEKTGELDRQIREEGDQRRQEIRDRIEELRERIRTIEQRVGRLATGSLRIRWRGLVLLVVGIALTTWPTEIAGWLGA